MPTCPSCGTDNSDSARFCRGCGKGMPEVAPATVPGVSPLPQAQPGRSSSTNAALVIVLVLALIGIAGAAGYWFLAGPGKKSAEVPVSVAPPTPGSQPAAPMPQAPVSQTPPPLPAVPANDIPAPPQGSAASDVPPPVPASPPPSASVPPAVTAPVAPPAPPKPRRQDPDESAFFPDDGGRRPADPNVGRWDRLRAELYRCGYDQYCQERVRQRYCNGYWGRIAECVPAGAYPQPGSPPPPRGYAPY